MKNFYLTCLLILAYGIGNGQHPDLSGSDEWVKVNIGFAKCSNLGETSGEAFFDRDDFRVLELFHRRGQMYAFIDFDVNGTALNTAPCVNDGLFKHDTIINKWIRVAMDPMAGAAIPSARWMTTNGDKIFAVFESVVYEHTEDYALHPTGWKVISKSPFNPLQASQVFSSSCPGTLWGIYNTAAFTGIGDTLFAMFYNETCPSENTMGKFNINTGLWYFERVGALPFPERPAGARFVITDFIGGYFRYFVNMRQGNDKCIPDYIWVFDPRDKQWKNISEGPNWNNITGASDPCVGGFGCRTGEPCAPNGCSGLQCWALDGVQIKSSWNKRKLYLNNQQGVYEWVGNGWNWVSDRVGQIDMATTNGIYVSGNERGMLRFINANFMQVNKNPDPNFQEYCPEKAGYYNYEKLNSPDDGNTLYGLFERKSPDGRDICVGGGDWYTVGIYRYRINPFKPQAVKNLHLETGTYIGGTGNNDVINVGVGGNYHLFAAGNFSNVTGTFKAGAPNITYNGASASGRGKIIKLNTFGDTILATYTLGNIIYDYEIQNFGQYRMAVTGDFGVSVLDSNGNLLWTRTHAEINAAMDGQATSYGTNVMLVDIAENGNVVVTKGPVSSGTAKGNVYANGARFLVYNNTGAVLPAASTKPHTWTPGTYITDIAIKGDTVYSSGFYNDNLTGGTCGESGGLPVQSGFVRAYWPVAGQYNVHQWQTWGFDGSDMGLDQADCRVYRINIGKDGKLYALGEAAGGNSVFRWNGKTTIELNGCSNPSRTLVSYDPYNTPYNTKDPHIAYFATIDPNTGVVSRGQYMIPRDGKGLSNSNRVSDGYIHADQLGFVYVGSTPYYAIAGREVQYINGYLAGKYAGGDMALFINMPDYTLRTFWGVFSDSSGKGAVRGFGMRDNVVAMVGKVERGRMLTGGTRVVDPETGEKQFSRSWAMNELPLNGDDWNETNPNNEAYLAVWYQDVWNHSQEPLEPNVIPGVTIIDPEYFNCGADFSADRLVACTGQTITFTDSSQCDSVLTWDFGAGASVPAGVQGKGPFPVTYSTPGLKTIRLTAMLKSITVGGADTLIESTHEKFQYLTIIDDNTPLQPIIGSEIVCEGMETVYEVPHIDGITSYTWEVPASATILDGQGGNKIRMTFGATSGTVTVKGHFPCGTETAVVSKAVIVNISDENRALFVVGAIPLSAGDAEMKAVLESKGLTVLTMVDSVVQGTNGACSGLIVISNSVNPAKVEFKFRETPTPVIVYEPALYPHMAFTNGRAGVDYGTVASATQINIINNTPDLGTLGVGVGTNQTVYTSASSVHWGVTSPSAINIASVVGDPFKATFFGYETGSTMMGYSAPARRVGLYFSESAADNLSAIGDSTLYRAICWARNNCPNNVELFTTYVSDTVLCPGDSIKVYYTSTGVFDGTAPPAQNITIDNTDFGAFETDGNWGFSTANSPYTGANYAIESGSLGQVRTAAWRPEITYEGEYRIMLRYPTAANHASNIRVDIYHLNAAGGSMTTTTRYINQKSINGFDTLGVFYLDGGYNNYVRISSDASNLTEYMVADIARFESVNLPPTGNVFSVHLSNNFGNFNVASTIGSKPGTASADTIYCKLPNVLPGGGYRVRVRSTAPSKIGTTHYSTLEVPGTPGNAGTIFGNSVMCLGDNVQQYFINKNNNYTGYRWASPLGSSIAGAPVENPSVFNGGPNDTLITVTYNTAVTGDVRVFPSNACVESTTPSVLAVSLNGVRPNTPTGIFGADTVCDGGVYTYTVSPVMLPNPATAYIWQLPAGATITSANDSSNSITVQFATPQSNGWIKVWAKNSCGISPLPDSMMIIKNNAATLFTAGAISGKTSMCTGETNTYSVTPIFGATAYHWTVPGGNTIVSTPVTSNSVQIEWNNAVAGGNLSVAIENTCGTGPSTTQTVNVIAGSGKEVLLVVGNPGSITGLDQKMKTDLEADGWTVTLRDDDAAAPANVTCQNLIIISATATNVINVGAAYKNQAVPLIANNHLALSYLGMVNDPSLEYSRASINQVTVLDVVHEITYGFDKAGVYQVYSANGTMAGGGQWNKNLCDPTLNHDNAVCLITHGDRLGTSFVYEAGVQMGDVTGTTTTAPARRVSLFSADNAATLTANGDTLFKRAVCWATNTCTFKRLLINTDLLQTRYCSEAPGEIEVLADGNFAPGTQLVLQLDFNGDFVNANGNLGAGFNLDTITIPGPGTYVFNDFVWPCRGDAGSAPSGEFPQCIRSTNTYDLRVIALDSSVLGEIVRDAFSFILTPTAPTSFSPASLSYCAGELISLTANGSGSSPNGHSWNVPDSAMLGALSGGTFNTASIDLATAVTGNKIAVRSTRTDNGITCYSKDSLVGTLNIRTGNKWTGSVSTDWHTTGNWDCGFVPNQNSDAYIQNVSLGAPGPVIIDNNSVGVTVNGTWLTRTNADTTGFNNTNGNYKPNLATAISGVNNFNGTNYRAIASSTTLWTNYVDYPVDDFMPASPGAGSFVLAYYSNNTTGFHRRDPTLIIKHDNGTDTLHGTGNLNASGWVEFTTRGGAASYKFTKGRGGYIRLVARNSDGSSRAVIADAIRLTPTGSQRYPLITGAVAECRDIITEPIANVQVAANQQLRVYRDFTQNFGTLILNGGSKMMVGRDIKNDGVMTLNNTSVIEFNGTGYQGVRLAGTDIPRIEINNATDSVTLEAALNVTQNVTFTSGKLLLDRYNLTLSPAATITGVNASKYFVTRSHPTTAGYLVRQATAGGAEVSYPIGIYDDELNAYTYNPAFVTNAVSGTTRNVGVRAFEDVYEYGMLGSKLTATNWVRRTWEVTPQGAGVNATLRLQFDAGHEGTSFLRTSCAMVHHSNVFGADWDPTIPNVMAPAAGAGPYSVTMSGITNFSSFGITTDTNIALPLTWIAVSGYAQNGHAVVQWATRDEVNCAGYAVQKWMTGEWKTIGTVACGNTAAGGVYTFSDLGFAGDDLYRIKSVDVDGKADYSKVVRINASIDAGGKFILVPNPVSSHVLLSYTGKLNADETQEVSITSLNGVKVYQGYGELAGINTGINNRIKHLAAGMYIVTIVHNDTTEHIKMMVVK